jgi:hypothetical protein
MVADKPAFPFVCADPRPASEFHQGSSELFFRGAGIPQPSHDVRDDLNLLNGRLPGTFRPEGHFQVWIAASILKMPF